MHTVRLSEGEGGRGIAYAGMREVVGVDLDVGGARVGGERWDGWITDTAPVVLYFTPYLCSCRPAIGTRDVGSLGTVLVSWSFFVQSNSHISGT